MKKRIQIGARISQESYKMLNDAAKKKGVPLSSYISEILEKYDTTSDGVKPKIRKHSYLVNDELPIEWFTVIDEPLTMQDDVGGKTIYISIDKRLAFYKDEINRREVLRVFDANLDYDELWEIWDYCGKKCPRGYMFLKTVREELLGVSDNIFHPGQWWVHFHKYVKLYANKITEEFKETETELWDKLMTVLDGEINIKNKNLFAELLPVLGEKVKEHPEYLSKKNIE